MDEVRIDRLIAKHGKDTLLVIICDWPISEKYKDKPELIASLEYLVRIDKACKSSIYYFYVGCIYIVPVYLWCGKDILLAKSPELSGLMQLSFA